MRVVSGNPDPKHVSTSFVERQNLSMRMSIRRFTRLTNAFSKKIENHAAAVTLWFTYYNFCRVHQTLRVTPAMEAGIANHVWSIEELRALLSATASATKRIDRAYPESARRERLSTRRVAIVGGAVGLLASGVVLVLLWRGVAGVLRIGHTDLMYLLWPSCLMLTITWDKTLFGITLTVISVALNLLTYGAIATLVERALRLSLWKSH